MKAVTAENLVKIYPSGKKAVNGASFSIEEGEVFGFLGPNGAGKTTAVKLLNGMLSPSGGSCRIYQLDPFSQPEKIHQISGVVTEHAQMYDSLTGLQNLIFYGKVFGLNAADSSKRALELLDQLGLADAKDRKLEAYSTGMRQRLSLARALVHKPKILFLDEPTSGLDPESVQSVNNLIKSLAQDNGVTVFLCTHQLRYAQEICACYGLIDEGELLASGTLDSLREMLFSGLNVKIKADFIPAELGASLDKDNYYKISVASEEDIPLVVNKISQSGGKIYHISSQKMSLEEIYFALLEKKRKNKQEEIR